MEALKLTADEIRYIALFENLTGAATKDCVTDDEENKIILIIKRGDMGLAIGKKGGNIQKVRQTLGKKIEVVEYSEDVAEFIKNLFHPYRVNDIKIDDKKIVRVDVDERDRAMAIGTQGKNIRKIKNLARRHHGVSDVIVA